MTKPKPIEWVSWFEDDGRVRHYPAASERGRWIVGQLADLASTRCCAASGCDRPARPRSKTCSDSHARALRRATTSARQVRDLERVVRVSGVSAPDLPETPQTRTNDADLAGATRRVIADTADKIRCCANCGADISDRRAGARFCKSDACRKALARRAAREAASSDVNAAFELWEQQTLFGAG